MTKRRTSGVERLDEVDVGLVLGGEHDGVQAHGPVAVVADRHLGLAVGAQVGDLALLADLGEPLGELVRQVDRQRHQLGGLVAGVAEHQALVAGALQVQRVRAVRTALAVLPRLVDALGDVRRLRADRDLDPAGAPVEALGRGVVADVQQRAAHDGGDVGVGLGGDLAGDVHETGGDHRLDRDPAPRVLASSASRTPSEIWSQILSGCPSVTDSEVNRRSGVVTGLQSQREASARWPGAAGVKHRHDGVPHRVGHHVLAGLGHRALAAVGAEERDGVGGDGEAPGLAHLVEHQQVAALAGQLGAPVLQDASRSRRRSRRRSPRAAGSHPVRSRDQLGEDVGVALSTTTGSRAGSSDFLILVPARVAGRKSATAAAITTTSAPAARSRTAAAQLRAPSPTRHDLDVPRARGPRRARRPASPRAPRAAAAAASATPCRPEERLPRKRTGSSGSRVPPAETTTRRPARSRPRAPEPSSRRQAAAMSAGSGMRPGPVSAPVRRPEAGSSTVTPRERSRATLACTAGFSHISVCMAGHQQHRAGRREQDVGQQVVGEAVRGAGQQVRGGGGDDDEVGVAAQPHVRDLVGAAPDVGRDRLAREGLPGGAPDEVLRGGGGDDGDVVTGLGQLAQQQRRLVGGDAPRDPEDDARAALGVTGSVLTAARSAPTSADPR